MCLFTYFKLWYFLVVQDCIADNWCMVRCWKHNYGIYPLQKHSKKILHIAAILEHKQHYEITRSFSVTIIATNIEDFMVR